MKLLPVICLAAGWVVLNVPLGGAMHVIKSGFAPPVSIGIATSTGGNGAITTAWTLSGTSLAVNTPCAAHVNIVPGSAANNHIVVSASSASSAQLAALQVKTGPAGTVAVSAGTCPVVTTSLFFSGPEFNITITVPAGTPIAVTENGNTDYTIGDVSGDLTINSHGSGDVTAGQVRNVNAVLIGDGDAQINRVTGTITAALTGAGDLHIDTAQATSTALTLTGDGDVKIDDGNTGTLTADMSGHGDVSLPDAASLQIMDRGDGDVTVGNVTGTLNAVLNGSGDLHSGVVAGDAALVLNGNGDADVAHVGGKLSQTTNGSGDVTIGQ